MVRFNSSGHETDKRQKIMNTILIAIFAAIVICSTILLVVRISKIDNNNIENNQINTQNSVLGAEKKVSSSYAVMEESAFQQYCCYQQRFLNFRLFLQLIYQFA